MPVTIEGYVKVMDGVTNAAVWYDEKAVLNVIYRSIEGTPLYHTTGQVTNGDLRALGMLPIGTQLTADKSVGQPTVVFLPGKKTWFGWIDQFGAVKEAVHVDEPYANEAKSPYKLYYAVDTEKLFMNIDDNWEFIGSPNINVLQGEMGEMIQDLETGDGSSVNLGPILARIQQLEDALANNTEGGGAAAPENLFKTSTAVAGYLPASGTALGAMDATRKEHTSDYISVAAGELVTIQNWVTPIGSSSTEYLWMAYQLYDANKNLSGTRLAFTPNAKVLSDGRHHRSVGLLIPDGVHFIRVSARLYNDGKISVVKTVPLTEWTES